MQNIKNKFLTSNSTQARTLRTIAQGVLSVLVANVDLLIAGLDFSPEFKALLVALTMAILSPVMGYLSDNNEV